MEFSLSNSRWSSGPGSKSAFLLTELGPEPKDFLCSSPSMVSRSSIDVLWPTEEKELPARMALVIICGRLENILSVLFPASLPLPRPRMRCRAEARPLELARPGGGAGAACLEELAGDIPPPSVYSSQSLGGAGEFPATSE